MISIRRLGSAAKLRRPLGLVVLAAATVALGTPALASTSAANRAPIGHLDSASVHGATVTVTGWAADLDTPNNSIAVRAVFTPNLLGRSNPNFVTNIAHSSRPDVAVVHPELGPNHGFSFSIQTYQAGTSTLCLYGVDLKGGPDGSLGCQRLTVALDHPAFGHLDSVTAVGNDHIEFRGWAADPDTPSTAISINLLLGGPTSADYYNAIPAKAALARQDVASAHPELGPNHGFDITVAARPGRYPVCAVGFDTQPNFYGGTNIGCITVTVS